MTDSHPGPRRAANTGASVGSQSNRPRASAGSRRTWEDADEVFDAARDAADRAARFAAEAAEEAYERALHYARGASEYYPAAERHLRAAGSAAYRKGSDNPLLVFLGAAALGLLIVLATRMGDDD